MKGKRKTLNASDVLSAMEEMEFQRFITPLKEALEGNDQLVYFLGRRCSFCATCSPGPKPFLAWVPLSLVSKYWM